MLRQRAAAGVITEQQLATFSAEVWRCNTPHELHRRTHGLVGSARRGDRHERWRVTAVWVAILLALVLLTWLTIMAAKDGLFTNS